MFELNTLTINHFGIIVPAGDVDKIEKESGNKFVRDDIQGVSVLFVWNNELNHFCEYITREGRAANYELGFNHICYDVGSTEEMNQIHKDIVLDKQGVRLTLLEPSPTKNCNKVAFYKLKNIGIVEFNVLD